MNQVIKKSLHTENIPHLLRHLDSQIIKLQFSNHFRYRCDLLYFLEPTNIVKRYYASTQRVKRLRNENIGNTLLGNVVNISNAKYEKKSFQHAKSVYSVACPISLFQFDVVVKETSPTSVITPHRKGAKLKCASASQATKFPRKRSEAKDPS